MDASDDDATSEEGMTDKAARQHYVDVAPSELRRKARLTDSHDLEKPRYKGVKTSRAEMFGDGDEKDYADGEDQDSEDASTMEGLESSNDEEIDSEEANISAGETDEEKSADDEEREDANEHDEGETEGSTDEHTEGTEVELHGPRKKAHLGDKRFADDTPTATTVAMQEQETLSVMQQIREKREQDANKGRDVQKQIKNWEKALRLRIAFQKIVTDVSRIPPPEELDKFINVAPGARDDLDKVAAELEDIASQILDIRMHLWRHNVPALAEQLDREVRTEASPAKALQDLERVLEPHTTGILMRWSNKIAAASDSRNGTASSRLQLRAMNQNVVDQIQQALAGDGMSRLVDRTRVWRGDAERLGVLADGDESGPQVDAEVFDDSDFYAQLLRDLIENAGMMESGTSTAASDALHSRKRKRNVDVRASKGRRLRYHVMENVQNFMPPIPRTTWDDAQIDRLFSHLASATAPQDPEPEPESEEPPAWSGSDGFRLFG